jgi:hypothetical protein
MLKLYELVGEYQIFQEQFSSFCEMVDSGELPEEAVLDTLDSITGGIEEKLDNIACIYKQTMYEAAMMKAEEVNMRARRKAKENAAERLKAYMSSAMQAVDLSKIETARNRLSFRKSEKVTFDDEESFVQWAQEYNPDLLTYKTPEPNKTVIKKILSSGQSIEGCRVEQCNNLQIK